MSVLTHATFMTVSILLASGCSQDPYSNLDTPRKFFNKQRVGSSPDYAIIKFDDINDHVITVHGFADDSTSCIQVADALNVAACEEIIDGSACLNPFSCRALNE